MKVRVTTGERNKGFFRKRTVYYVRCEIRLTPEENALMPKSGIHAQALTTSYNPDFQGETFWEYSPKYDGIIFEKAILEGGDEHEVRSIGQMNEKEAECLERLRTIQRNLEVLKLYDVEKSYILDLSEEIKPEG